MNSERRIAAVCLVAGVVLLIAGALIPAHLRMVDRDLLLAAAEGTPTLLTEAERALSEERLGAARLLIETAEQTRPSTDTSTVPGTSTEAAAATVTAIATLRQRLEAETGLNRAIAPWGGPSRWLDRVVGSVVPDPTGQPPAVLTWLMPEGTRAALLRPLEESTHPATMALVACRALKETSLLPPVSSASGQPLDAALMLSGALVESGRIHPMLMLELERGAVSAVQGQGSVALEAALLELLAAARRLNWEQLATLVERCEDRGSLQSLVAAAGSEGADWAPLISAIVLNGGARSVASYVEHHGKEGIADLRKALGLGTGAVQELVKRGYRIHTSKVRTWMMEQGGLGHVSRWLARSSVRAPLLSFCVKYLLWIDGLFLVVAGLWYCRHMSLDLMNRQFEPRPDWQRLVVVTAAAAVLLFLTAERLLVLRSAPSGTRSAQTFPTFTARLRLDIPQVKTPAMSNKVVAMLVAFFVIQLAIYMVGLGRLRYIRGQLVDESVKLKLLDNEESMFDAPLYIGIGGSVLALVMRLTGYNEVSLMASYSSTLFGILFCFVLKVVHVRPYRQRLILEAAERKVA